MLPEENLKRQVVNDPSCVKDRLSNDTIDSIIEIVRNSRIIEKRKKREIIENLKAGIEA